MRAPAVARKEWGWVMRQEWDDADAQAAGVPGGFEEVRPPGAAAGRLPRRCACRSHRIPVVLADRISTRLQFAYA